MSWQKVLRDVLVLWATIDPISTLVIFIGLTKNVDAEAKKKIAFRTFFYASMILLFAAILGQFVLIGMGISMLAFQVAGGIILFMFALKLVFENIDEPPAKSGAKQKDPAIYPLAFPSVATPGAILAMIVLTDNHLYPIETQVITVSIAFIVLLITYIAIRNAEKALSVLTEAGAELLVRLMGLLLAALSIQLIYDAVITLLA